MDDAARAAMKACADAGGAQCTVRGSVANGCIALAATWNPAVDTPFYVATGGTPEEATQKAEQGVARESRLLEFECAFDESPAGSLARTLRVPQPKSKITLRFTDKNTDKKLFSIRAWVGITNNANKPPAANTATG